MDEKMKTCPLASKNFQSNGERILQNKPEASYSHIWVSQLVSVLSESNLLLISWIPYQTNREKSTWIKRPLELFVKWIALAKLVVVGAEWLIFGQLLTFQVLTWTECVMKSECPSWKCWQTYTTGDATYYTAFIEN